MRPNSTTDCCCGTTVEKMYFVARGVISDNSPTPNPTRTSRRPSEPTERRRNPRIPLPLTSWRGSDRYSIAASSLRRPATEASTRQVLPSAGSTRSIAPGRRGSRATGLSSSRVAYRAPMSCRHQRPSRVTLRHRSAEVRAMASTRSSPSTSMRCSGNRSSTPVAAATMDSARAVGSSVSGSACRSPSGSSTRARRV